MFLQRHVPIIDPVADDLTANTKSASYKPVFGIGDKDSDILKGIARFGELTVEPGGTSAIVNYPAEEQMYLILEGDGMLLYDNKNIPVKKNDYMYLPVGVKHGISNSSKHPVRLLVMGYKIPAGIEIPPTPKLMMANIDDVQLERVGSHPPTTLYKLLMGTTSSKRDKLAVTKVMTSMFIMDFAPRGTNKPHQHNKAEEIYYVLRGKGAMVAGLDSNGNDLRHPCVAGDAYYYSAGTRAGFFSFSKGNDEHDIIFAVRSTDLSVPF
ncbi:MAG: cupin domain-containing protein [Candidatus Latescibacteria bacterium]|nr:cupin domain-containing protein [Candidatus Latescibacterota bacterium]